MIYKSIAWERLCALGHYSACHMAHFLYPDGSERKLFNRGKFMLRSLLYRQQLSQVFELFQTGPLKALPARYPELLDKPMRPYRFADSTVSQRVAMLTNHYHLLLAHYPTLIDSLYLGDGLELGHYPQSGCRVVLRYDGTFRREAELALSIINPQGQRVYSCAFSLAGSHQALTLVIGSMQGPEPSIEQAQDKVRELTKEGHGMRPKSLVVQLVIQIAQAMGAQQVQAVRKHAHVFQAKRYSSRQKANLQADYDELWQEFGGHDGDAHFVLLQAQLRKPLDEIASKKRAMYRRRYEWLDQLIANIDQQLASR